jgi:pilus assembly protein CpaC
MFARGATRHQHSRGRNRVAPLLAALAVLSCFEEARGQQGAGGRGTLEARVEPPSSRTIEVRVGQGRLITLTQPLNQPAKPANQPAQPPLLPFMAVGNPAVVDFFQVDQKHIRLIGRALGTTDFTVTNSANESVDYEVRVVADLDPLRKHLRKMFPDATLEVSQLREKLVVEGQARSAEQVSRIIATVDSFIRSVQRVQVQGQVGDQNERGQAIDPNAPPPNPQPVGDGNMQAAGGGGLNPSAPNSSNATGGGGSPAASIVNQVATNQVQVINLIRIPTSQQVLLKVRVAELNRTGFRQIGADLVATIPQFGTVFGTQIAGNGLTPGLVGKASPGANLSLGSQATAFGTFSHGQFNVILTALRKNNLVKILAEPNLVALNGHQANFLAGGEFPVPSFSGVGAGSPTGGGTSSTQFKEFGVRLSFLPIILDGETIRLTVDPEVSSVDFALQTTLVPGGSPVPGLNVRKSHTTVELRQGETLAIAGLMQLELDGSTQKIPGLGDLPYIGGFFSNTTTNRVEKELIVLVTPYIIEPMAPGQVPPSPGAEVVEPNDLEFFFLNRIEGRTGIDGRSTTSYDDPLHLIRHSIVERKCLIGPSGFSK